jgi:hypothetical protein
VGPTDSEKTDVDTPAVYAFHDPKFVSWWLGSLYLLRPESQLQAAVALRQSVHQLGAVARLEEFIGETAAVIDHSAGTAPAVDLPIAEPEEPAAAGPADAAMRRVRSMWKTSPSATVIGVLGIAFVAGKGLWTVVRLIGG